MKLQKLALTLSVMSLMMSISSNMGIPGMISDLIDNKKAIKIISGYIRTNSGELLAIESRSEKIKKDSYVKVRDFKNNITYSCTGEQLADIIENH